MRQMNHTTNSTYQSQGARTTRTQTISLLAFTSANSASLSKSCRNMCLCNRTGMPEENFSKLLPIEFGGSNASAMHWDSTRILRDEQF
eukprot:CCRYP_008090-RD/>CCRYP_008090-RD protein AED:0.49 eAED:1.00 QI:0/0/0/1/0/0/2/0/87